MGISKFASSSIC